MNQRYELANLVYTHGLNGTPNSVADAILAAGYVKADGEEWGVQRAPRFGSTISEMPTKGEAKSCVRQWPGSTLVRRNVGRGPWEVA